MNKVVSNNDSNLNNLALERRALSGRVSNKGYLAEDKNLKFMDSEFEQICLRKAVTIMGLILLLIAIEFALPHFGIPFQINLSLVWIAVCILGSAIFGLSMIGSKFIRCESRALSCLDDENANFSFGLSIAVRARIQAS